MPQCLSDSAWMVIDATADEKQKKKCYLFWFVCLVRTVDQFEIWAAC